MLCGLVTKLSSFMRAAQVGHARTSMRNVRANVPSGNGFFRSKRFPPISYFFASSVWERPSSSAKNASSAPGSWSSSGFIARDVASLVATAA